MQLPNTAKLILCAILLLLSISGIAQTITGKVYREGTDSVIAQASVYYNGSQTGASTNREGEFQINQLPGKMPLVVSCIGYISTTVTDYSTTQLLKVYLKPKVNEMGAITVRGQSGMSRLDMERLFVKEFIGTTPNALGCTITNMDDIDLFYSRKSQKLSASCDKPIEIENKKLAYHISYYLDKFIGSLKSVAYQGNCIFKDTATPADQKKINNNREDAYAGSRMEFIRALCFNNLSQHGFKIYSPYFKQLSADSILAINKAGEKYINARYRITIVHNNDNWLATDMVQTIADCYINQNGFHDEGLKFLGYMGNQRVGDMLPFDYQSAKYDAFNSKK